MMKLLMLFWLWIKSLINFQSKPVFVPEAETVIKEEDHYFDNVSDHTEVEEKKMKIAISSGHGLKVAGAIGILNEVAENRRVVSAVVSHLRKMGVIVEEFHDDVSTSVADNLVAITSWHNRQDRDIDVSVHFNAFRDPLANGTEVLYRTPISEDLAEKVARAISDAGGFRLRPAQSGAVKQGTVLRNNLFFLNNIEETPAILLEVCFVSNQKDVDLYNANFDAICLAIAQTLQEA